MKPSLLFYLTNIAPATLGGAATFGYKNYAWLKLGERSIKTFVLGIGAGYNIVNVAYNYNMNLGNYEVINHVQHNINVCINFLQAKKQVKSYAIEPIKEDSTFHPYHITKVEGEVSAKYYVAVDSHKKETDALIRANEILSTGQ